MPLLQVTALDQRVHVAGRLPLDRLLERNVAALPPKAPIMILIHGRKYSPAAAHANPHRHILSLTPPPLRGVVSWPRQLGFGQGDPNEGLCISFGWPARSSLWKAYRQAPMAGNALADLLQRIHRLTDRPVHILAHSLGARVALQGIAAARRGNIGRVILLSAAEFAGAAARCLDASLGKSAEFINVISRENDLFDLLMESLIDPLSTKGPALGLGLTWSSPQWLDLQIDNDATRAGLTRMGHPIPPASRRVCHWSTYLRPGLLPLYAAMFRRSDQLPLARLRLAAPQTPDPRWSRLKPGLSGSWHLPFSQNATS